MAESKSVSQAYFNGMIVGVTQSIIFHPIDLIRVRAFLKKSDLGHWRTWFNGLSFNIASSAVKQMAVFPTQELLKQKLNSEVGGGILAGAAMATLSCPINSVKTPLQMSRNGKTTFQVAQQIMTRHGVGGFYRGGTAIFCRDLSWAGVYFPLYAYLQQCHRLQTIGLNEHGQKTVSSILAGVAGMLVAYPFDGSRLYRQHHFGEKDYTFWCGFKKSFALTSANFKSLSAGLIRVPLATTFCHMMYLWLQNEF